MFFPFWSWVKAEKYERLQILRVAKCSFSLPRVWRHWSYTSRMTPVDRLMDGPWKHMLGHSLESKTRCEFCHWPCHVAESQPQIYQPLWPSGSRRTKVICSLGNWIGWQWKHCTSLREQILCGPVGVLHLSFTQHVKDQTNPTAAPSQPPALHVTRLALLGAALLSFSTSLINHFLHQHHKDEVRLFWAVSEGRRLAKNTLSLWRQCRVLPVSAVLHSTVGNVSVRAAGTR